MLMAACAARAFPMLPNGYPAREDVSRFYGAPSECGGEIFLTASEPGKATEFSWQVAEVINNKKLPAVDGQTIELTIAERAASNSIHIKTIGFSWSKSLLLNNHLELQSQLDEIKGFVENHVKPALEEQQQAGCNLANGGFTGRTKREDGNRAMRGG